MICGVDPGLNGALITLNRDGEITNQSIMPKIGSEIDIDELRSYLMIGNIKKVFTEDVHAIFGASSVSTFNFGRNLGLLEGCMGALGIAYVKVKPMVWQKHCFEGVKEIKKAKKGAKKARRDTKAMALVAAKRLYPSADLRPSERAKVAHNGLVDALLLAHFGLNQV